MDSYQAAIRLTHLSCPRLSFMPALGAGTQVLSACIATSRGWRACARHVRVCPTGSLRPTGCTITANSELPIGMMRRVERGSCDLVVAGAGPPPMTCWWRFVLRNLGSPTASHGWWACARHDVGCVRSCQFGNAALFMTGCTVHVVAGPEPHGHQDTPCTEREFPCVMAGLRGRRCAACRCGVSQFPAAGANAMARHCRYPQRATAGSASAHFHPSSW